MQNFHWSKERIKEKIALKSGLNETDSLGYSALLYACMQILGEDQSDLVERVIQAGGDVNKECHLERIYIPLLYVCRKGNVKIAKLLLKYGANPNVQGEYNGATPLILASKLISDELLLHLIRNNADTELKDNHGKTALMYAANLWNFENAVHLVEAGANINAQDNIGRTALIHAMDNGFDETVDYLLRFKIDIHSLMMYEEFDYYFKYFPSIRKYIKKNIHTLNTNQIQNWNRYRLKILYT